VLGALCPLEPRLGKKLVEPLTNIIQTTPAKSLLYECIHTVSVGMTPHLSIVQVIPNHKTVSCVTCVLRNLPCQSEDAPPLMVLHAGSMYIEKIISVHIVIFFFKV
jgi:hypothetical protein